MQFRTLGTTDIQVSRICLGTMTWGNQNSQDEAFEQIEYALNQGVNFIDTAEIYAFPPSKDRYGKTETIIGNWFKKTGRRDDVILATKMMGWGHSFARKGRGLVKSDVKTAVEGSLKRLQTDVIDLYQLHWPQRKTNFFGQRDYMHHYAKEEQMQDYILQILEGLKEAIAEGKIRHIGLSNETPYGIMKYLEYAKYHDMPRMQSVQNPYSLVQRQWDQHIAEVSLYENIGLLAYSPLAGGMLSGKYMNNQCPKGSRFTLPECAERMQQYQQPQVEGTVEKYVALAQKYNITPVQLAIAWVNSRNYLTSNIIGATSIKQLKEVLSAEDIHLPDELIFDVEMLHNQCSNPVLRFWGMNNPEPKK
ncbi:MAG: aldo/keto reductase [Alphaproteobacteria bacterium]